MVVTYVHSQTDSGEHSSDENRKRHLSFRFSSLGGVSVAIPFTQLNVFQKADKHNNRLTVGGLLVWGHVMADTFLSHHGSIIIRTFKLWLCWLLVINTLTPVCLGWISLPSRASDVDVSNGHLPENVHLLRPTDTSTSFIFDSEKRGRLEIFCHRGEKKSLLQLWTTLRLSVDRHSRDVTSFYGVNETDVTIKYNDWSSKLIKLPLWGSSVTSYDFHVFRNSCVGIATDGRINLTFTRQSVSLIRFTLMLIAIGTFFLAPRLCRNAALFYGSSTSVGILAFILILVYVLYRAVPKGGAFGHLVLAFGSTISYAFYALLWKHFQTLVYEHQTLLMGYIAIAGEISIMIFHPCK